MKHLSITYSPIVRQWELIADGAQSRYIAFRGTHKECKAEGKNLAIELNQPLYLFDKSGNVAKRIK